MVTKGTQNSAASINTIQHLVYSS